MALSREDNEIITRTGSGTPMGNLFRRYWIPALRSDELPEPDGRPIRLQLLGERLVAFRDTKGRVGLVQEFCAHRGAPLWFARNAEGGLRCSNHGWKYDISGHCVDLPGEPEETGMRQRIKIKAYPCHEQGDVIWTYMGPPELKPDPPGFEWSLVPSEHRYVSKRLLECNYLQGIEGAIDSSHTAYLHGNVLSSDPFYAGGEKARNYTYSDTMPVFEVAEFEGGLLIAARRNTEDGKYYWRVTPWIVPCFTVIPPRGAYPLGAHAWVPIDDESCWTWAVTFHPRRPLTNNEVSAMKGGYGIHTKCLPGTFIPVANKHNDYLFDADAQKAGITASGILGVVPQDNAMQEGMGPIADRTTENLISTDDGIIWTRRMLLRLAKLNGAGENLPGQTAESQRVRSCGIELPIDVKFTDGARSAIFAPPGSDPVSI